MGEIYEVMLSIDPERRHKLGRRASLCEAYLGIIPGISTDNMNILVEGFIPDGEAIKTQSIKEGDYLCSINSRNVTPENLDDILSSINAPINVGTLKYCIPKQSKVCFQSDQINSLTRNSIRNFFSIFFNPSQSAYKQQSLSKTKPSPN